MKPMLYVIAVSLCAVTLMVGLGGRCDPSQAALTGAQMWVLGLVVCAWVREGR